MSEPLTTHRLEVIRERVCNFLEVTQEGTSPRTIRFAEDCVVLLRALAAAEAELETLREALLEARDEAHKQMKTATGEGYAYYQGRHDLAAALSSDGSTADA